MRPPWIRSMRRVAIALLLLVALGLLFAGHVYVVKRLVLEPDLAQPLRALAIAVIAAGGLSLVLQPLGERLLSPARARWIAWPAGLWMGLCFLLLTLLVASDAVLWLAGRPASAATASGVLEYRLPGLRAAGVLMLALSVGAAALREGLKAPRLVRVAFEIPRWPRELEGFRIVQISDIHIGPILDRRFASQLVERVNALAPDLVAVTGDLVDGDPERLADEVAPFAALRARHGVYFVTGNHDHLSGAPAWVSHVSRLGMRVLRNQRVGIGSEHAGFDLAGVDDHHGHLIGGGAEDLDAALLGRDPERPLLLLAHDPSTFRRARHSGVDLQISGHTHGGQIWPFGYLVRLLIPWVAGRHRDGRAQLYVSRGTGFWGPPMRLFAPAEITEITLRAEPPDPPHPVPSAL